MMNAAVKQEINGSPLPQRIPQQQQQQQHVGGDGGGGGGIPGGNQPGGGGNASGSDQHGPGGPGGKGNMNRNNRNNSKNRLSMPNRNRGPGGMGMGSGGGGGGGGGNMGPGNNRPGNNAGNNMQQSPQQGGGDDSGPNQHMNRGMHRGNRGGNDMDNSFVDRRRGGGGDGYFINEKLRLLQGPLLDIPPIEAQEAKFSGRNRLYVGNLTNDATEEELMEMFKPFGEISEVFMNKEKNYAFVRVDYFSNAEKAKRELDGTSRKNRVLRVRFAPNATAIRVKNLTAYVTNELLYKAFEVFGPLERAVVQVDERGKPTGEGIVEFQKKPGAAAAIRYCSEKCYFLTSSLRPVIVEPYTYQDDNDGLPETQYRQIIVDFDNSQEYVTDEGLVIPSIPRVIRNKIQSLADAHSLTLERQNEVFARGVAEVALQLLGGSRRLTPNNRHQWPKITIICDESYNHRLSEIGICAGRHLASHGLKIHIFVSCSTQSERLSNEIELFAATGNYFSNNPNTLQSCDLVIIASLSSEMKNSSKLKNWFNSNRAPVLAIDPPVKGIEDLPVKCSVLPILPLNDLDVRALGKLYLCNLGIPDKFYQDSGIKYKSPFDKFVIPIHKQA